ncbi:MAG TPA: hypothetical protein VKQ30_03675 [Ktedonobacterales bacterium]|nr:hypothetical protein [Ktedonobacterales bacterium]
MRQWRDSARSGEGPAVGQGRGSGASWGPAGSSGGRSRGSGANWGAGGQNEWDNGQGYQGYDEPPAARSSNRNQRRPTPDYEEVDLERALVPTRGDLMPMDPGAGAPALPGMPTTDEEERSLGIRRPAYIPATGERRTRKLGTWRVVSGVLSVMLVCVASCGLAGLLGHNVLASFGIGPSMTHVTPSAFSTYGVPVTPVATPGPAQKFVTNATTAKYVSNKGEPLEPTSSFPAGTYVYVLVTVRNIPNGQSHVISVRWFYDNIYLSLNMSKANTSQTINGNYNVDFALVYTSPGVGMAKIYFDRPASDTTDSPTDPTLAQTISFQIVQPTGTVTPGSGTPGSGTPHASIAAPPVAWRGDPTTA